MNLPTLAELEAAAALVHQVVPATPQIRWPLLCERSGAEVWVKHENHTALGAFKVRGGVLYMDALRRQSPAVTHVIAATRGNHGQSIAFAAANHGLHALIVVPRGNSREKNAAMRSLGAELIEHGEDFQEALDHAVGLAQSQGLHLVPSFHPALLQGVASYAWELFHAVAAFDAIYVPIGLGSGICGTIAVRNAMGLNTEVIGVVAEGAPAYALSFAAGKTVSSAAVSTIADGMACRVPNVQAFEIIRRYVARIVTVSESEIRSAMRTMFSATHNVAEGAGAAALAALLKEADRMKGRRVAVVHTGGNVDTEVLAPVLAEADQISVSATR